MKVLHLCFTPYHIKVSNYLTKEEFSNDTNDIVLSSCSLVEESTLYHFVEGEIYNNLKYVDINMSYRVALKKGIRCPEYILKYRKKINMFISRILEEEYDKIIYYSDNPIPYQLLFLKIKKDNPNISFRLIEEGLGIYNESIHIKPISYIDIYFQRVLFFNWKISLFTHAQGGFEDEVFLREPDLFDTNAKKIKMSSSAYKDIIMSNSKEVQLDEPGTLFTPTPFTYLNDEEVMDQLLDEIFAKYQGKKEILYVKLHPSEAYVNKISSKISQYSDYIRLINRVDITAEDLVLNDNITGVLSDFSSTLVNAHYLREGMELISYYDLLVDKYGLKYHFSLSIFDKLLEEGVIKQYCCIN